jgi:hypothetical protein
MKNEENRLIQHKTADNRPPFRFTIAKSDNGNNMNIELTTRKVSE